MRLRRSVFSANRMVAVAIAMVTLAFVMLVSRAFYGSDTVAIAEPLPIRDTGTLARATEVDSDTDGLADWEEALWGTDSQNPDSDGDGVRDGDERSAGRDPARAGFGTLAYSTQGGTTTDTTGLPTTATDAIARELIGTYLSALQNGDSPDPVEQEAIVNRALESVAGLMQAPQYTTEDVRVVPATDASRLTYVESVRKTLYSAGTEAPSEYNALSIVAGGDKARGLADLRTSIAYYTANVATLRDIPVPEDATNLHVQLVSTYLAYISSLENITFMDTDPARATLGLSSFMKIQGVMNEALINYLHYKSSIDGSPVPRPASDTSLEAPTIAVPDTPLLDTSMTE